MKFFKIPLFIALILSLAACSKKSNPSPTTTIEITVNDGQSGAEVAGSTVNLYETVNAVATNTPKYSQTTDQNGKVTFSGNFLSQYYVVAEKGAQKNYYNGLLPIGIFTSQTEINFSPGQTPAAVVGGVKFKDVNGDGVINAADDVAPPLVNVTVNTNNFFSTAIY